MVETNTEYIKKEELSEVKARKRHIFDIYNSSKLVGAGWCGLEYIYLTPESCGNTFEEMNYPLVLVEEEPITEELAGVSVLE